jgi:hypothetical protein
MNKILYLIQSVRPSVDPIVVNQYAVPRPNEEVYLGGNWYTVESVRYIYGPVVVSGPESIHVVLNPSSL